MELRLCALYPDQMNIYADRGNILLLQRRCEWRGIGFTYTAAGPGDGLDPASHDFLYMGGGQDRDQRIVATDLLKTKRDAVAAATGDGAVLLAVCGGYQLLGHSYQLGDERIEGLGLTDLETVREAGPRLIGNVEIEVPLMPQRAKGGLPQVEEIWAIDRALGRWYFSYIIRSVTAYNSPFEIVEALPAAVIGRRGQVVFLQGGDGEADTLQVCLKSDADDYSWKVLQTG
jgi:hypothetical protein